MLIFNWCELKKYFDMIVSTGGLYRSSCACLNNLDSDKDTIFYDIWGQPGQITWI